MSRGTRHAGYTQEVIPAQAVFESGTNCVLVKAQPDVRGIVVSAFTKRKDNQIPQMQTSGSYSHTFSDDSVTFSTPKRLAIFDLTY